VLLTRARLPVDMLASVFAALALGAVATGEPGHSRFYLGVSTEMVKYFVGQPTLNLCLSYFLQHLLALRSGTSNYAQGIIFQAIHVARALGLQQNSHGNRGLLLFSLIYMADQLSISALTRHPANEIVGTALCSTILSLSSRHRALRIGCLLLWSTPSLSFKHWLT